MTPTDSSIVAASYARVAASDEGRIADQHAVNTAFATKVGALIPAEAEFRYSDNGASGCSTSRPSDQRLRAAVTAGSPFRIGVAADRDRLGRFTHVGRFRKELAWFSARGVLWVFATDPIEQLTDPAAVHHATIRAAISYCALQDHERELRAEWSRRRRRMRQEESDAT
jgi:DNA invertase Pin-like site-specific DNA recombinase